MLKDSPKFFNPRTLNVWRPEVKNLMVHTHEILNGQSSLYVPADIFFYQDLGERPYTSQELLSSMADGNVRRFRFHRNNEFSVALDGHVTGAYKATPTAWVLTLQGGLASNIRNECPDVTIVCFYETGDYGCNGQGFGLIPCRSLAQLGY